ncbi:M56 family metallopeptidase [Arenimonas composti]|uniref:Peptidase M56 domain-containing protein n=1 Tax=Arenimonas composti TR7-09 = DSM 18010 TaxID=1121013 RepID=A0A091BG19_9GAMM|nr:M56 family metallopeptidase [Arenimonas composti]KFN50696.1 hypothetical protein P873_05910 [Arenimonas composti TR7-09 = DSM 18010]
MSALALASSLLLTLVLQASLLLGLVWIAERLRLLRDPGHAELAWRAALFAGLLATGLHGCGLLSGGGDGSTGTPAVLARSGAPAPAPVGLGDPVPTPGAAAAVPAVPPAAFHVPGRLRANRNDATSAAPAASPATTAAPPGLVLPVPELLALALVLLWAAASLRAGRGLARQLGDVRRLQRGLESVTEFAIPAALRADADTLAAEFGIRRPRLHLLEGLASPMLLPTLRGPTLLLLPAWTGDLAPRQRRALLAHEFAHLARRDPAWRLATRIALLPLAWHPLARHALARLEALAEHACDACAARLQGDGRPLAECLAVCLEHAAGHRSTCSPRLAVAMADDAGAVVRRVANLLEKTPMNTRTPSPALRRGALVAAVAVALALPGLAITLVGTDAVASALESGLLIGEQVTTSRDGISTWRRADADGRMLLRVRGEVRVSADDRRIEGLGDGAFFEYSRRRDGVEHAVVLRRSGDALVQEFEVDGESRPFDSEGRAWLAAELPALLRETGLNALQRGVRLLAEGGTPALLAEIAGLRVDHVRRAYLEVLFANAPLDAAQWAQAMDRVTGIGSDFERRLCLHAALAQATTPARRAGVFDAAAGIASDFELAELLIEAAKQPPVAAELGAWQRAVAALDSDFELRRVLDASLEHARGDRRVVLAALEAAERFSSDFELRQLLETAAPAARTDAALRARWLQRAGGLGSDFERRSALTALIDVDHVDIDVADGVLVALAGVRSDFEAAVVLTELAGRMPYDAGLVERYRAAARRLDDFERGRAERALDRFAAL